MDRVGELLKYFPEHIIMELLAFLGRGETGQIVLNVKEGKILIVDVLRKVRL